MKQAVSKVLSEFQRDGVLETRKISILDRKALSEPASGLTGLSADDQIRI